MKSTDTLRRTISLPSSMNTEDFEDMDECKYVEDLRESSSLDNVSEYIKRIKKMSELRRIREKMTMSERLEKAAPYNVFFNCLEEVPETFSQPNAIEFIDLICPSLGKLRCSLHICYNVSLEWMLSRYEIMGLKDKPLTVVHSSQYVPENVSFIMPNLTCKYIKPLGCHDTKMSIFVYEDESLRISIGSPNPDPGDWKFANQCIWVSPLCPKLDDTRRDVQGESPTGFKKSLLEYLRYYNEDCLKLYVDYVRRANFSELKVFFIYSVPGEYIAYKSGCHMYQVGNILSRFCQIPDSNPRSWQIIVQARLIGFLGNKGRERDKYYGMLAQTLAKNKESMKGYAQMNIIYPTAKHTVSNSFMRGCKLGYSSAIHRNQPWIKKYLRQWKADAYNRTKVVPGLRSYCRISPCLRKMAYCLLTSAQLTRSSWGIPNASDTMQHSTDEVLIMRSYEVGVLFIPTFFGEEFFNISNDIDNKNIFPLMFDLPLVPYGADDVPWNMSLAIISKCDEDSEENHNN